MQNLLSAAVVIGALRVKRGIYLILSFLISQLNICCKDSNESSLQASKTYVQTQRI